MCVYVWVMFVCMYWCMLFAFERHISKAFAIHLCDGREKKKFKMDGCIVYLFLRFFFFLLVFAFWWLDTNKLIINLCVWGIIQVLDQNQSKQSHIRFFCRFFGLCCCLFWFWSSTCFLCMISRLDWRGLTCILHCLVLSILNAWALSGYLLNIKQLIRHSIFFFFFFLGPLGNLVVIV